MKKFFFPMLLVAISTSAVITSCKKTSVSEENLPNVEAGKTTTSCNADNYTVTLLSRVFEAGKTTFRWRIVNNNPFNNNNRNGAQDLSHWTISFACETNNPELFIASASYQMGVAGTIIPVTNLDYKADPSQNCYTNQVFKFDAGTQGTAPTYYTMVLNGQWSEGMMNTYYKSGQACCGKMAAGVGCLIEDACSLSQGYYFARPATIWPMNATVGTQTYTQAEGKTIWNASNAGGIADNKKGFLQVATIYLAIADGKPVPDAAAAPELWNNISIIEAWLSSIPKITPSNLRNQTATEITTYGNVRTAAGYIGQWISDNHCE